MTCYYLLNRKCAFQDLGVDYFDQLNHEKLTRYFVKCLARLGHIVKLEPALRQRDVSGELGEFPQN